MDNESIKVVLVDDHQLIIDGIRSALQNEKRIQVIGSFKIATDLFRFLQKNTVNIIILDVNLPEINGIEICYLIAQKYPHVKILGLSNYNDPSLVKQMVKKGAKGYLLKDVSPVELIASVTHIHEGNSYFSTEIQKILADSIFDNSPITKLTRREKEVLKLVTEGNKTLEIAKKLNISRLTVETHRRNLLKKLGVSNSFGLIKAAKGLNLF